VGPGDPQICGRGPGGGSFAEGEEAKGEEGGGEASGESRGGETKGKERGGGRPVGGGEGGGDYVCERTAWPRETTVWTPSLGGTRWVALWDPEPGVLRAREFPPCGAFPPVPSPRRGVSPHACQPEGASWRDFCAAHWVTSVGARTHLTGWLLRCPV